MRTDRIRAISGRRSVVASLDVVSSVFRWMIERGKLESSFGAVESICSGAAHMFLRSLIRTIPNHPKPGIQFRDVTTLLRDPKGLALAVDGIADRHRGRGIDLVAGIEARGFTFGTAVAYSLGCGFIPIRKTGKLPGETIGREYELEYGTDRIEIHTGAVASGSSVLLVDDLIATGGTAEAAVSLLRSVGANVQECAFVVALPELGGIGRLERSGCSVRWLCDFSGH